MKGGEQHLYMNTGCFANGLLTPVHELLHTLGFVHFSPHILHYVPSDFFWNEPNPEDPISLVDQVTENTKFEEKKLTLSYFQVELTLAYSCVNSLTKKNLIDYLHRNRRANSMRIDTLGYL